MPYEKRERSLIGNILRIEQMPCAIPPMLAIELAAPAFLKAFWTVLSPDFKESVHILSGRSLVCNVEHYFEKFDLEEAIGGEVAARVLFTSARWLDVIVWWFFIASVAYDGAMEWTSQIIQAVNCGPGIHCSSSQPYGAINDGSAGNQQWFGLDWSTPGPCAPVMHPTAVVPPKYTAIVMASAQFEDGNGNPVGASSRIMVDGGVGAIDHHSSGDKGTDPTSKTIVFAKYRNHSSVNRTVKAEFLGNGKPGFQHEYFPLSGNCYVGIFPPK